MNAVWPGVLDPEALQPEYVDRSNRLADLAKAGDWRRVLGMLETGDGPDVNHWRVGGTSWFTPLHQAAWLGASVEVITQLVRLGGWRSLRTSDGDRPVDLAARRGHRHLLQALAVREPSGDEVRRFAAWDEHLGDLISQRTRSLGPVRFRPIPTELLALERLDTLSFRYPGMYGGFVISIHRGRLFVESSSRVVGGSGQAHVITDSGCVLVEEGFD